jgi:hypothetical protein
MDQTGPLMANTDIWSNILHLAQNPPSIPLKHLFKKPQLTRQTDLVQDLGLVGEDAFEFMDAFSTQFSIQQGDYEWSHYFESEGLWLLPSFRKKQKRKPVALGMLELAAHMGTWDTKTLEMAYETNDYTIKPLALKTK